MLEIGMRAHDIKRNDIVSLSEKLFEMGITTVQLALPKSVENIDFDIGQFCPNLARKLKKELDKNNVSVAVLGCYITPCLENESAREKELNRFIEFLKYAKYMSADMVGTETCHVNSENGISDDSEEAYQICLNSFKLLRDIAEKLGVRIGIEGVSHHVISTPKKMKRLIDELNSPNIAVIFDPVNLINIDNYKNQKELIDEMFDLLGDKIEAVHLKDFDYVDGKKVSKKVFDGIFDYEYLIKIIKERKPFLPILLEEESEETYPLIKEKLNLL